MKKKFQKCKQRINKKFVEAIKIDTVFSLGGKSVNKRFERNDLILIACEQTNETWSFLFKFKDEFEMIKL